MKYIFYVYISIFFVLLDCNKPDEAINIDNKIIQKSISNMLISSKHQYKILYVSPIIKNICAVSIKPPCREFPNLILFYFDINNKIFKRVYQTFCMGIQDEISKFLDLHTEGNGIDFHIDKEELNPDFNSDKLRQFIIKSNERHGITIPYKNFFHMHRSDNNEYYTINKTNFYNYAIKLIGNRFIKYPNDQCLMYNMPNIISTKLQYANNTYQIECITDNKQIWKLKFSDIDKNALFVKDEVIEVEKIQ